MNGLIALKGDIVHAQKLGELTCADNGYLVTVDGTIEGVFPVLPEKFAHARVADFEGKLIIPSFVDMHVHAPQYVMMGMGMDMELLDWLNTYTFKTEARFADNDYARAVYAQLARELIRRGTTRVCMFSSIHREATHILMEELERAGVTGYVGKVNMDRNSPDYLREGTSESLAETERWIDECAGRYRHLEPILTPRFTPCCSNELMAGLGALAQKCGLRVQSHLSENFNEIKWIAKLHPDCGGYWETYHKYGLFGEGTVMAHCIHSDATERKALRRHKVTVAHCPDSNTNLYSGVAPIRRMLNENVNVSMGSDVAGGAKLSMLHAAGEAIRASKLRYHYSGFDESDRFLTVAEAFYLITSAGQSYFGAEPGFATGDKLHALILSDGTLPPPARALALAERLERLIYADDDRNIVARFSEGRETGAGRKWQEF